MDNRLDELAEYESDEENIALGGEAEQSDVAKKYTPLYFVILTFQGYTRSSP